MSDPSTTETEARLVVVGPARAAVFESIKMLELILDVRVGAFEQLALRDEYFDDAAGSLVKLDCALRLREATKNGEPQTLLTFKGPAQTTGESCVERMELEEPWSPEFLNTVLDELSSRGVEFDRGAAGAEPRKTLLAIGLQSIQVRENKRQTANLGLERSPLAELCLDSVSYTAGEYTIDHREVEIEARGQTSAQELLTLAGDFEERFPGELLPWPWSKTAVGRGLERMERRDELAPLLSGRELTADGYKRLGVYLKLGAFMQAE
jgi:inorganic triphosphatase YgiF